MMGEAKTEKSDKMFASDLEKYRAVFVNSPTALVLLDKKGCVVDVNDRLQDWLGYDRSEILGKCLWELPYLTKSSKAEAGRRLKKRIASEDMDPYKLEFISREGKKRIGEIYGTVLRDKRDGILVDLLNIIDVTQAEQEKSITKEYLDLAKVMLVSLDMKGRVTFINKTGARILGCRASEIVGKDWFDNFLPKDLRDDLHRGFNSLMGTDNRNIEEVFKEGGLNSVITKNGQKKTLIWNNTAIKDNNGKVIGTLSSGQDVTERERIRKKLEESMDRFNLMMKGTQDGIWDWDLRTNQVYFSPRWKEMIGYRDDELPNDFSEWEKRIDPEQRERVLGYVQRYVKSDGSENFETEFRLKHKDGHWVNILARAFMQKNKKGENIRLVGSHVDITERKKREEEIRAVKERLERLTNNANEAIFQVNLDGGAVKYANRAAERIFGYTLSEYRQDPELGRKMIHPDFADKQASIIKEIAKSNKPINGVILGWRAKDGRKVIMKHTIIPLLNESGKITGFESISRDITKERARKESLRQGEQRLREAQEIARLGNWEWYVPDDTIVWSDGIEKIFDIEKSELPKNYEGFLELVYPADIKKIEGAIKKALQKGTNYDIDHRIKNKSGQIKYIHEQGKVFFGPEMKPIKMVGTAQDITERKEIEISLAEKVKDLEKLNQVMVGRELKMIEMKEELSKLKSEKNGDSK